MQGLPEKLERKILEREETSSLRRLTYAEDLIDFSSNDYLGFASSKHIFDTSHRLLLQNNIFANGATGSRLLSGNHKLYIETENMLANVHNAVSALIFNSGYDANIGFFSSVPQRGDFIFYDELIHASIRDGIRMSNAKSYKFAHNNLDDLYQKLQNIPKSEVTEIYIVTESVFSMDGDTPDLKALVSFCNTNKYHLIIDEAHATGVFGKGGVGLLQQLGIENQVFARIHTFGKAMGCHGAVILGSAALRNYLVNFARSFIYTTGLPPHALATIQSAYQELYTTSAIKKLRANITLFNTMLKEKGLSSIFIPSDSAIHCCILPGNSTIKKVSKTLQKNGYDVKPILSPTVPEGQERLRICLHSFNSEEEIAKVLQLLATFVAD